jgi:hypothetical protein
MKHKYTAGRIIQGFSMKKQVVTHNNHWALKG